MRFRGGVVYFRWRAFMTHGPNDAYQGGSESEAEGLENWSSLDMRVMEIPRFPRKFENPDLENLLRSRLSQVVVLWPDQAIPLVGYMGWPNEPAARDEALRILRSWPEGSESVPPRLGRIQHEWLRVADVFHCYCDLIDGQHQQRRGGPSIGKATTLVAARAQSRGTSATTLWHYWQKYKDVAHLITAATLICREVRTRSRNESFGPFGLSRDQFVPFQMVMMMPDLVLAVALDIEQRGLSHVPHARTEPAFDPKTVWRTPPDINVAPFPSLIRKIRPQDLAILNERRAGNRGRANQHETTPVFG
jgi:hypothetical protein